MGRGNKGEEGAWKRGEEEKEEGRESERGGRKGEKVTGE